MLKEVEVSNALEEETQPDNGAVISIDAYKGCQLQCPYCFQMNNEEWSKDIQIRTNIADVLKEEVKSLNETRTELYIGSLSVSYMDIEKEYGLTRKILEVLKDTDYRVFITTKPVILLGLSLERGNQNVKMYEWVKEDYSMYAENYSKILFEAD